MMNQTYRLVWSLAQQAWVVAGELARSRKKSSAHKVLSIALLLAGAVVSGGASAVPAVNALPTGESIVSGSASFDRSVDKQLTINQSTNKLITNWNSFDVGSAAKVVFAQPNTNSIALNRVTSASPTEVFGQVTANGHLVIVNPNGITFGAGSQVSAASIIGSVLDIQDSDFNNSTLLFSRGSATGVIDNQGVLISNAGSVSLLAPTVKNSGTITSKRGNASLINADVVNLSTVTPSITTGSMIKGLIQQSGNISATQISGIGGRILLTGDTSQSNSQIQLSGVLQANQTQVNGRSILINGNVNLNGTSNILDLTSTDGYKLSNAATVTLSGASSGFSVNGTAYTVIRDINQLQAVNNNLAGNYVLAKDVDARITKDWNAGAGFAPLGNSSSKFSGILDGLGHVVNGLNINRPTENVVGLFGWADDGYSSVLARGIHNIGLINISVNGGRYTGGLIGYNSNLKVTNSYIINGIISNANNSDGAYNYLGGLIGYNRGVLSNSSVSGRVISSTDPSFVGGLIGHSQQGMVRDSYATASVTGGNSAGGLIGFNSGSVINSYASGSISGAKTAGGLVGFNMEGSTINNSYATGAVNAVNNAGGLVGFLDYQSKISNSYASGRVSGAQNVGGLVGANDFDSLVTNSYWDVDTTGQVSVIGWREDSSTFNVGTVYGNSASTPTAYNKNSYANFDFNNTWFIAEGTSRPMLRAFLNSPDTDGKIAISNLYQLQGMAANLAGQYYLTRDIDASATTASITAGNANNRSDVWGGAGFAPVGTSSVNGAASFKGTIDGLGHHVSGLTINRPTTDYVGLLGLAYQSKLQNIGLVNAQIKGNNNVGGLAGLFSAVSVDNSYVTGSVTGTTYVGGLAGKVIRNSLNNSYAAANVTGVDYVGGLAGSFRGNVSDSYATGSVKGTSYVGGLIGESEDFSTISSSHATGDVAGDSYVGGLTGSNIDFSTIDSSYATGRVTGSSDVGGLVGLNSYAFVNSSYSTASVAGSFNVGGLIGYNVDQSTVSNSYATGRVTGTASVGGLVGSNAAESSVTYSFAKGSVTGVSNVGGLVGYNFSSLIDGSYAAGKVVGDSNIAGLVGYNNVIQDYRKSVIQNSYWDTQTSGQSSGVGTNTSIVTQVTGLSSVQFKNLASFAYWGTNIDAQGVTDSAWRIYDGQTAPLLRIFLKPVDVVIGSESKTYDALAFKGGSYSVSDPTAILQGSIRYTGNAQGARNAGSYVISGGGLYSGQQGYDIRVVDGNLTINKKLLTISAVADSKVYDGKLTSANKPVVAGLVGTDSIALLRQIYSDKNAGTSKIIKVDDSLQIRDKNNGNNYDVVLVDNQSGVITPKTLTISTVANSKVYDGGLSSAKKPFVTGLVAGDRITGLFQQYETKTVGENKKLLIKNGYVLQDGNNGGNYVVTEQASNDGVITAH